MACYRRDMGIKARRGWGWRNVRTDTGVRGADSNQWRQSPCCYHRECLLQGVGGSQPWRRSATHVQMGVMQLDTVSCH